MKYKNNLINIFGRNYDEYMMQITDEVKNEIEQNVKSNKKHVLEYSADDSGNIEWFLAIFKNYVLFNEDKGVFYYWTGRLWREDKEQKIQKWIYIAMCVRRDYSNNKLEKHPNLPNFKKIESHTNKCCDQRDIKAVYNGIKCFIGCKDSKFNKKPNYLNLLNGTVDLSSGTLYSHRAKDYITMMIPFQYNKNHNGKVFRNFLLDIIKDEDYAEYIQRLFGYFITGETKEQLIFFAYGNGANGKSTLLSLIRYTLFDYATTIPAKVITSTDYSNSASSEIAQLPNKRMVCCSELNCDDTLNEGRIKIMSSGETISTRQLYQQSFTFNPEFKCIVDTNYLPTIKGTDHGIWRRIKILPFNHTITKDKLDKDLLNKLKLSKSEVLAWLIEGAHKYYSEGLGTCCAVEKATKKYHKEQDTIGSFVDACLEKHDGLEIRARDLYNAYTTFCYDNFLTPISETKFGKDFASRGYKKAKDKISRKYVDLRFKHIK